MNPVLSNGDQREFGVLRERVAPSVCHIDGGFGSCHAHALPLGSVRVIFSQIRGHGRFGGFGIQNLEVGGETVGFCTVRFIANVNPVLSNGDQREFRVLGERVAAAVRSVDRGFLSRHAHALTFGSVRVGFRQIRGRRFRGGFGRRLNGRLGGRRFGGNLQHEVLHPRVGDHAVRFAAHLNPAAAQGDQTQRRALREVRRAAIREIDGRLLSGYAHGVLAVRIGVGVVQIVQLGVLCGLRRGSSRRCSSRFGGLDQLEVGGETISGHLVLFVEQLVPFAALRDQTGDKALLYLHAVGGMGIGRVEIHGGLFDRDADVHRALHFNKRNRLVGGFGRRFDGRLGRGRFGRVRRFAQPAQKRVTEGTLGIADIAPFAVLGHERHGSALRDRAESQVRVFLRLRVDGQAIDGHDHGFLGIKRDKRCAGRLRLRGGLSGCLRLGVLLVKQIILGVFVGQAGHVQNLRALDFVDVGLEGGNSVLRLLAVHAVGFARRQPAALNQRVLQRDDVRLRGIGRGAVLIFGLVAAEHVLDVLRLRVTGFAGVVDQHDPVLVFGDLAEAHVPAHAALDDGVVAGAIVDVGLIDDDLDQNRFVERGQKVGFVVRVDGGLDSRSLGGLRRLLRLGEALVAEQKLRVRVGQTVHRQKRRGGGHVHVVLEGHDRVVGRVVILAGGFSVQPAHGDELQLQFADADGGGVGADRAVVRLCGRAGAGVDGDRVVVQILEGGRAADAVHRQSRLVVLVHVGLERLHGGDGGGVIAAGRLVGV